VSLGSTLTVASHQENSHAPVPSPDTIYCLWCPLSFSFWCSVDVCVTVSTSSPCGHISSPGLQGQLRKGLHCPEKRSGSPPTHLGDICSMAQSATSAIPGWAVLGHHEAFFMALPCIAPTVCLDQEQPLASYFVSALWRSRQRHNGASRSPCSWRILG
jgi:hypothetical protein